MSDCIVVLLFNKCDNFWSISETSSEFKLLENKWDLSGSQSFVFFALFTRGLLVFIFVFFLSMLVVFNTNITFYLLKSVQNLKNSL